MTDNSSFTPFKTPEQVAAEEALPATASSQPSSPKPHLWQRLKRREWLVSAVIVIFRGVVVGFVLNHTGKKPVASADPTSRSAVAGSLVPSTLSGLPVRPEINKQTVTGVMIENSPQARPQAGLGQAGVVFEAIAEGGVTRFLALFQDTAPENVGPVRSARPYYVQWALGFDAGYAHVGGSPEALANIKAWKVRDLDQFHNAGSYHRIAARAAPHNMYTGIHTLNQLEASKGYSSSTFEGFARKAEKPVAQPTAKAINLTLSGPAYNVHYDYAAATNSYQRSQAGAAHVDANTNAQISPKVVIALVIPYSIKADGYHSDYSTIGSGQAYIYQDGGVTVGSWSKAANDKQLVFKDAAGKLLRLNRGQTWLTAVAGADKISSTP